LVFSRRRSQWKIPQPIQLAEGERLRIALAVATPSTLGTVKYKLIWEKLQAWAGEQRDRIELLGIVNPANRLQIDRMLERKPHILHFIGHGRVKDEMQRDVRQIALVDTVLNDAEWLDADKFIDLFNRHQPGIVFLQTCEGAMSSDTDAFIGIASSVVQQNIPVVVAMQYEISNATAQSFALEFYGRLARNEPVDKAAQEGRRRIALGPTSYTSRDFATPVLFMRVRDGRLFLSPYAPNKNIQKQTNKTNNSNQPRSVPARSSKNIHKQTDNSNQLLLAPANSSEEEKIKAYKSMLEHIQSQLAHVAEPHELTIEDINYHKRNLRELIRGIQELRHSENTHRLVDSVDGIKVYTTRAIDSLSIALETLSKTNTVQGENIFYQELRECQHWLSEAKRFFKV